jgi:hypothetical protein
MRLRLPKPPTSKNAEAMASQKPLQHATVRSKFIMMLSCRCRYFGARRTTHPPNFSGVAATTLEPSSVRHCATLCIIELKLTKFIQI